MIIVQVTPGPRFLPIVSRSDAGGRVPCWLLAVLVTRQFTLADSGITRVPKA